MTAQDDRLVESSREALSSGDRQLMMELAPELATTTDDEALERLLDIFLIDCQTDKKLKTVLVEARHPQTSARLAERTIQWIPQGYEMDFAISQSCDVLARRGDASVIPRLREATDLVVRDRTLTRDLLIARMTLGDGDGASAFREQYLVWCKTDNIAERFINRAPPALAFDFLAPIVQDYQSGDNALRDAAHAALYSVVENAPSCDPRWFELGLEIFERRARPAISACVLKLLDSEHPERQERLAAAHCRIPGSRSLAKLVTPEPTHPLLENADDELVERYDLANALTRDKNVDEWNLLLKTPSFADVDIILEGLGELTAPVTGLSFAKFALDDEAITALATWPTLSHFKRIRLAENPIGAKAFEAFLKSPHLTNLEELDLRWCEIAEGGFQALARAKTLPSLRSLHFARDRVKALLPLMGPLLQETQLTRLERLTLVGWDLDGIYEELGKSVLGRNLLYLNLSNPMAPGIGKNINTLLHFLAENQGRLETLVLSRCYQYVGGSDFWRTWPHEDGDKPSTPLTSLRRVVIEDCRDEKVFTPLVNSSFFPFVTSLSLRQSHVNAEQLRPLVEYTGQCALEELDLHNAERFDREALDALARWPQATKLRRLNLGGLTDLRASDLDDLPEEVRQAIISAGWPD